MTSTTFTTCPYCRFVNEPPEDGMSAPTVIIRCRICGVFFGVMRDDRSVSFMSTTGVYFIECAGFIKIGLSSDWSLRRRALEAATPLDLTVVGVIPTTPDVSQHARILERALHARFAHLRHRYEWFRAEPELLKWIASHALSPGPFLEEERKAAQPAGAL